MGGRIETGTSHLKRDRHRLEVREESKSGEWIGSGFIKEVILQGLLFNWMGWVYTGRGWNGG